MLALKVVGLHDGQLYVVCVMMPFQNMTEEVFNLSKLCTLCSDAVLICVRRIFRYGFEIVLHYQLYILENIIYFKRIHFSLHENCKRHQCL